MLQDLREKSQGKIAWIIIGLISLTFVLVGAESVFDFAGNRSKTVAEVNGQKITASEVETLYQQVLQQADKEALKIAPEQLKKELLQSLIDKTVLTQRMERLGMEISPQRLSSFIAAMPNFRAPNGEFSKELYQRFLASTGYSDATFRAIITENLLREQLQQGVLKTEMTPESDLHDLVKYLYQKRSVRYAEVPKAPFKARVGVNDTDIKAYYDEHKKDFMTQEQIALEYIHLSFDKLLADFKPTDAEIEKFYNDNVAMFSDPERVHVAHILIALPKEADEDAVKTAKAKVEEVQNKIKAGESFDSLAKQYSQDQGSAAQGGDLQWLESGEMVPEFEKAAFALKKTNQISSPIRTEFGFHIIKLVEKKEHKVQPFTEVKSDVLTKMKQEWAQEELANKADQLTALAYDHPDSLQAAADKLKINIDKTDLFSAQTGPKEPVLQNTAVLNAAFSNTVKDDKNNSDLIKADDKNYIVVRVMKHVPAAQKPIDEVKAEIEAKLIDKKAEALAKQSAEEMLKTASSFIPSDWKTLQNVNRNEKNIEPALLEGIFSLPRAQNPTDQSLKMIQMKNGDFAVVALTSVEDGSISQLPSEDLDNFKNALSKHWGELEFALYANQLIKEAKIQKYPENL